MLMNVSLNFDVYNVLEMNKRKWWNAIWHFQQCATEMEFSLPNQQILRQKNGSFLSFTFLSSWNSKKDINEMEFVNWMLPFAAWILRHRVFGRGEKCPLRRRSESEKYIFFLLKCESGALFSFRISQRVNGIRYVRIQIWHSNQRHRWTK